VIFVGPEPAFLLAFFQRIKAPINGALEFVLEGNVDLRNASRGEDKQGGQ